MYCFPNIIFRCTAYAPTVNFLSLIRIARLAIVKKLQFSKNLLNIMWRVTMNWDPNCGNYSLILRKTTHLPNIFFWSTKTNVPVWIVCIKRRGYSFEVKIIYRKISNFWKFTIGTAWKVSIFGVILVHIFPHSDWI